MPADDSKNHSSPEPDEAIDDETFDQAFAIGERVGALFRAMVEAEKRANRLVQRRFGAPVRKPTFRIRTNSRRQSLVLLGTRSPRRNPRRSPSPTARRRADPSPASTTRSRPRWPR